MNTRTRYHLLASLLILFSSGLAFGQNEKKVAYGILIDNTGSLRSQFDEVLRLGKAVARSAAPKGPVSVFNFEGAGDRSNPLAVVRAGSDWSQDPPALENFIDDLYVLGGQTTLLDAINTIAKDVSAKVNLGKQDFSHGVVILITDGEDRVSHLKEGELIKELRKSGIKIYAFGLVRELGYGYAFGSKGKRARAEDLLTKFTKETGGRVIFLTSQVVDTDKLVNELFAPAVP